MNANSDDDDKKLIYFPSLAERDRLRKEQQKVLEQDNKGRESARVPFLNLGKIPPFTGIVALVFIAVQLAVSLLLNSGQVLQLYYTLGFVPLNFSSLGFINEQWGLVYLLSPFTYGFLHGSWMHLVFNLVMWLALGTMFEKEFGSQRAAQFFFLCACGGALVHFLINPFSAQAVIGASASISGCFAVALVLFYRRGMMGPKGRYGITPLILFWLALMIVLGLAGGGMGENVAWIAHVGGFFTGLLYISYAIQRSFKFWRL
jgi:membrane associated rhomboid family serine protease